MAVTINSNIAALNALRRLGESSSTLSRSFERLSSGLRINRPSDDAAGLSIASDLNLSARVFNRGVQNANDGIGMLNVAEGSLQELSNVLVRIRELAQQAANGTLSNTQRSSLNSEAQSLRGEYNRIINSTRFNGLNLHGANQSPTRIQMGYGSNGGIGFTLGEELERNIADGTHGTGVSNGIETNSDMVLADFGNDGKADLFSAKSGVNTILVNTGNGDGTFTFKSTITIASGTVQSMAAGDLNSDGNIDLVVGGSDGRIYQYFGNGGGAYALAGSFIANVGQPINDIALANINNDTRLDIAFSSDYGTGGLGGILYTNGSGGVIGNSLLGGIATSGGDISVGDFNNDGLVDVAVSAAALNQIYTYTQTIPGALPTFTSQQTGGLGAGNQLAVADVNNDGFDDLLVGSGTNIRVKIGDGTGTFANGALLSTGTTVSDFYIADLDDDGNIDIVSAGGSKTAVLFGNGDGTFQNSIQTANGAGGTVMAIGDLNGDGVEDLALNSGANTLAFIFNTQQLTTLEAIDLSSQSDALASFGIIETAMQRITDELGVIGAAMSRISSGTNALRQAAEDYQTSESRITDADVADESATLLKSQILQQSGSAILAQANLLPSLALLLLDFNTPPPGGRNSG